MSQCSTTTANSAAGHDGIVAGGGVFASQPVGIDPTGLPDPDELMEEQW
jgi:hypothetical protein